MGIRFNCENGHELHVKSFLAGKRGICPKCGVKVEIPRDAGKEKDSPVGADAKSSNHASSQTGGAWFIRIPSGEQFGPADERTFRDWVAQGRVGENCLVWREGWPDWKAAADVLSDSSEHSRKPPSGSMPPPIPKPITPASDAPAIDASATNSPVVVEPAKDVNVSPAPVQIDTEWASPKPRRKSRFLLYLLIAACLFLMIPLVYVLTRA